MSSVSPPPSPVRDVSELRRYFAEGGKPVSEHRVGIEHEKIAVLAGGQAPDFDRTIGPLLERLASGSGGWERVQEEGRTIALRRGRATVSLEPGGQLELSDEPRATAGAAAAAVRAHLHELAPIAREVGITFLATGFRPLGTLDDVPWMPKGRYRVMREYLPRHGALGLEMMKRTATVQANLDYTDQADCAEKMRVAMGITSLVTALWAASPLCDGKPSGWQSWRARAWLDTDDARCGLLPFVFDPDAAETIFASYTEWALDVPLFFVHRDGQYQAAPGLTFRRFLGEGFAGQAATLADWELHLSTLFPEVRLKRYLEVRGADSGPLPMVEALPAFYRGVLYDAEARRAAWALVADWSFADRVALRREVPRAGLRTEVRGRAIGDRCRELVRIARDGLERLGDDDPALLDPAWRIAETGRTVADQVVEAWQRTLGDPGAAALTALAGFTEALRLPLTA
ncbi:MAG: glutamate--cysteine ligase [Myxococcales bacterium]|nr:glutamate--cysteine ligase [Myxococcales bacterium]